MKTSFIPALLLLVMVSLYSCQKEIDIDLDDRVTADSAWYISSIHSIDYDSAGTLIDSAQEYYTYQDGKTICKNVDHNIMYSELDSCQFTYYYGQDKRITKFAYDYNSIPDAGNPETILFTYTGTGNNSVMADITWDNGDIQRDYISFSSVNKKTTIYDTVPRYAGYHDAYTVYHGTANNIDSVKNVMTGPIPGEVYIYISRLTYDAQNNLAGFINLSVGDPPADDSIIIQSHETRGIEISNTFEKVLSNMRWYPLLLGYSFNNIESVFNYSRYPIISGKRWSRYINQQLTVYDTPLLFTGNFVNTFDANNLLIHQEVPGGFANKYGGRASLTFTYIKLPK